ncbi:hypothetical protein F4859DRAFT_505708 [Xylaria cf. heliscus]|nr:hypothetical protein F4859DRAFT_505708 [Xylaria cf. heliscus]
MPTTSPPSSLPLQALLAMPTALRRLLLGAFASSSSSSSSSSCARCARCAHRPGWRHTRSFAVSAPKHAAAKYLNVAALSIPEFPTSAITKITPDDLLKTSSLISAPDQPLRNELTKLYTRNPATFVYAESDFYKLKKNTRVPEVCVLGRSNVGKSSFVNALANRNNSSLAFVSSQAGKTRSINTYGFGPAPTIKELQEQGPRLKDEDTPTHAFYLVDMPGYGHASLKEWGKNISLYLNKRTFVKGAIVLIDAKVGPKDSDFHLLQLLSEAQLKTAIVMTKADKVGKGLEGLRSTCKQVWDGIRAIEARSTTGNWAWEKDVYVTAVGAKDSDVANSTLTTARLAVARLAGFIKEERLHVERNQRWTGKLVSFDDLQYAPSTSSASKTDGDTIKSASLARSTPSLCTPSLSGDAPGVSEANSAFADLEQAAKAQHTKNIIPRPERRPASRHGRVHARAFHSTPIRSSEQSSDTLTRDELKPIIDDFVKTLKVDTPRDELRRYQYEREKHPPHIFKKSLKTLEEAQTQKLQQRFPVQTRRIRAIFERRVGLEERRRHLVDSEWPALEDEKGQNDTNQAMDTRKFEKIFGASAGLAGNNRGKGSQA